MSFQDNPYQDVSKEMKERVYPANYCRKEWGGISSFLILCLLGYRFLLDYVFTSWISEVFGYAGLKYSYSKEAYGISIVAAVMYSLIYPVLIRRGKFSDITVCLLILMYFIPSTSLYGLSNNDTGNFIFVSIYFLFLLIFNYILPVPKIRIQQSKNDTWMLSAVVALSLLVLILSAVYSGFRISFDFSEFYEARYEAREYNMPTVFLYMFNWGRFILPLGVVYYAKKKKIAMTLILSFAQILSFSFNGKKSGLFFFVGSYVILLCYNKDIMKKIPALFCVLVGLSLCEIKAINYSFIGQYVIRRVFLIPSYLGWAYHDYFSNHELDYLRGSIFRRLGAHSPYDSIPETIGALYYPDNALGAVNANTGLIGDAFSNFGGLSCLIYPFLIISLLKILSSCSRNADNVLIFFLCFEVSYMLLNGTFFKILLTNGVIVICFLMATLPRDSVKPAILH